MEDYKVNESNNFKFAKLEENHITSIPKYFVVFGKFNNEQNRQNPRKYIGLV